MSLAFFAQNLARAVERAEAEKPVPTGAAAYAIARAKETERKVLEFLADGSERTAKEVGLAIGLKTGSADDRLRLMSQRREALVKANRACSPIRYSLKEQKGG